MSVMDDAQVLWDYHQMHHEPRNTDIAIGLGSHDIGVAEHTADLYHRGRFPLIVFTGANAPTTLDVFPRGEAVHYAERAVELGVPDKAIMIEPQARNTGENFTLVRQLLDRHGLRPSSATIVCRPYQQRRAYATCRQLWPELEVICSSRPQSLVEYIDSIGDEDRVLNMLVGDTQRIWMYADRGFAAPQPVTAAVMSAYGRLLEEGYTRRLVGPGEGERSEGGGVAHARPLARDPLSHGEITMTDERTPAGSHPVGERTGTLRRAGAQPRSGMEGSDGMSVALGTPNLYTGVQVGELAEALLSVFECSGIKPNDATYVSTPITTGDLLIRWYEEHGDKGDRSDIRSAVVETNLATVRPLIQRIRTANPGVTVVEPASMRDIPGWAQPDYHSYWCAFVERFANRVVFNEGWQLSNGCAAEFATAALSGHELFNHRLEPMSVEEGVELIESSYQRLMSVGLDTTLLRRAAEAARGR